MPKTFRLRPTLHFRLNADLSVSIYARGRLIDRLRYVACIDPEKRAAAFADGWFGDHKRLVRWSYSPAFAKRFLKEAA